MQQLTINFTPDKQVNYNEQLRRLLDLLTIRPVTCQDAQLLGIAGSAFPRRIKDLNDKHKISIKIESIPYIRKFDNRKVKISQYSLLKETNNG